RRASESNTVQLVFFTRRDTARKRGTAAEFHTMAKFEPQLILVGAIDAAQHETFEAGIVDAPRLIAGAREILRIYKTQIAGNVFSDSHTRAKLLFGDK